MNISGSYKSGEFIQRKRSFLTESNGLCCDKVNCLLLEAGALYAGTEKGLSVIRGDKITSPYRKLLNKKVNCLRKLSNGKIAAGCGSELFCLSKTKSELFREFDGDIIDIKEFDDKLWVLTCLSINCIELKNNSEILHREVEGGNGRCLAVSRDNIYVGTDSNISVVHGKRMEWKNIMPEFSNMPDSAVNCLDFDESGYLWIGTDAGAVIFDNLDVWITPEKVNSLPKNAVYKIVSDKNGGKYFASDSGVIYQKNGKLKYFTAQRWVPENRINDIVVSADGMQIFVATDKGISSIRSLLMTFEDKCKYYEDSIEKYHIRRGYIAERFFKGYDFESGDVIISDNDGLWTGCYVAAESFRYAVTGEKEALEKARRGVQAMLLLTRITGIPGFTARAVRYPGERNYGDNNPEWGIAPDGVTEWKGETSSDEMTGHFFGLSIYYDLCADDIEKEQIKDALVGIMTHILENNYRLVDRDGLPTTWACWDPEMLNHADKWFFEKGTNSLEFLAFLKVCHHITDDEKYDKLYKKFVSVYHYPLNVIKYKIRDAHLCHIDDNLCFLAGLTLIRLEDNEALRSLYLCGIEDHYEYEKIERQPLFCIIHAALTGRDSDLIEGIQSLREMPLEFTHYPMKNSKRKDIVFDDEQAEWHGDVQLKVPLAYDERNIHRPDSSPFEFDCGEQHGSQEPTIFLLPYWIGRYYGLID